MARVSNFAKNRVSGYLAPNAFFLENRRLNGFFLDIKFDLKYQNVNKAVFWQ